MPFISHALYLSLSFSPSTFLFSSLICFFLFDLEQITTRLASVPFVRIFSLFCYIVMCFFFFCFSKCTTMLLVRLPAIDRSTGLYLLNSGIHNIQYSYAFDGIRSDRKMEIKFQKRIKRRYPVHTMCGCTDSEPPNNTNNTNYI